jgi:hypothetical protein
MTTFDGSTGGPPADASTTPPSETPEVTKPAATDEYAELDESPVTSLDMLLKAVDERDSEDADRIYRVPIPGLNVAMACRIDFPYSEWEAWQKLAIVKEKRKKPTPMDVRQNVLFTLVLNRTCEHLEYRTADGWAPITGERGEPIPYAGDEMRRMFNVMDEASLLRKLFGGKEGHILRAGQRVVAAAGYSDEADEREALEGASGDEDTGE